MKSVLWKMTMLLGLWLCGTAQVIAQSCTASATDLVFGQVATLGPGNTDVSGLISISCGGIALGAISGTVSVTAGSGGSSGSLRQMTDGGTSQLSFQLYRDAARTLVFGSSSGSLGGAPISFSGGSLLGGQTETLPFYGRVFGGQNSASPGTYQSHFSTADITVKYRICTALILCRNHTTSFSFSVSAVVEKECSVSATNIDFGSKGVLNSAVDANGQLDVLCTPGTDMQISLGNGLNGTSASDRKMLSPAGGTIEYDLYKDAAHTEIWGNTLSSDTLASAGSGSTDAYTVYGRVPVQPTPAAGAYVDTIIVTLTY